MPFEASRGKRPLCVPSRDEAAPVRAAIAPMVAIPIDSLADASLSRERAEAGARELRCDACDASIEGEPAGRGVFVSVRGDDVRLDEPVLCASCATAIGVRASLDIEIEEEDG